MSFAPEKKNRKQPLLGELAIEKGYARSEDIVFCLNVQWDETKQGKSRLLGEILIERGLITEKQLKELLRIQKASSRNQ